MRRALDLLYRVSGGLATLSICLICLLVCLQVLFNIIARTGLLKLNLTIPSYADFAGYLLAASSFLALAYTLTRGGHIRVLLLIGHAGGRLRLAMEILVLSICSATAFFVTWNMAKLTRDSWNFGDVSSGIVAIPLYIPQSVVLAGLVVFCIALIDLLVQTILFRRPVVADDATE